MPGIFKSNNNNVRTIYTNNDDSISDNDDIKSEKIPLSREYIYKSIPNNASNKPDLNLVKTQIEHRWRFFNINNRKLVEISIKHPNKERLYINSTGEWTSFVLDSKWDMYVTSAKYYYTVN
jgi:hypothetical protein